MKTRDSQEPQASHRLLLHPLYPILLCICFGLQNCIIPLVKELLRHSDTTPYFTTLMGAAFRIAPNIPELAERVLNTLLSLWKPLWRSFGALWVEARKKNVSNGFGEKCVFLKTLGMGLPCPGECLKRKVFEKGFCWEQKPGGKCFEKNLMPE